MFEVFRAACQINNTLQWVVANFDLKSHSVELFLLFYFSSIVPISFAFERFVRGRLKHPFVKEATFANMASNIYAKNLLNLANMAQLTPRKFV